MTIKDIIACNGFVLRGQKTLTERVVAHPTTLSPFPPGFLVTGRSWINYVKMESILACRVSCVSTYVF